MLSRNAQGQVLVIEPTQGEAFSFGDVYRPMEGEIVEFEVLVLLPIGEGRCACHRGNASADRISHVVLFSCIGDIEFDVGDGGRTAFFL